MKRILIVSLAVLMVAAVAIMAAFLITGPAFAAQSVRVSSASCIEVHVVGPETNPPLSYLIYADGEVVTVSFTQVTGGTAHYDGVLNLNGSGPFLVGGVDAENFVTVNGPCGSPPPTATLTSIATTTATITDPPTATPTSTGTLTATTTGTVTQTVTVTPSESPPPPPTDPPATPPPPVQNPHPTGGDDEPPLWARALSELSDLVVNKWLLAGGFLSTLVAFAIRGWAYRSK